MHGATLGEVAANEQAEAVGVGRFALVEGLIRRISTELGSGFAASATGSVQWGVIYRIAALTGLLSAGLLTGCHTKCDTGFISEGGVCVAYGVEPDAGVTPDSGVDAGTDAGPDTGLDAGTLDSGPVPDTGPRPDGGAPGDAGTLPGAEGRLLIQAAAVLPMVDSQVISPGEVYVEDGRIACIGPVGACDVMSMGATVVSTDGVVLPGLIDAHNHLAYNFLPEWMTPQVFQDSRQWRANSDYSDFVTPYRENKGTAESFCAMVQWGEVMSLANGTTTAFGAPQPRTCFRWLVRNPELSTGYNGFDADRMRTNTLGISVVDMDDAATLIAAMDGGDVTAYVIHLAEGISTRAREEFLELKMLGLLREEAVLIHATGLEPADFDEVAAVGAKVVWSPSSNMALYQDTTDLQAALQAGVSVSIAPDWTPSGADSLLHEVRFARDLVEDRWPGLLSAEDYVAMITRIPAQQLGVADQIGTLQVGLHADLLVLDVDAMLPFTAVMNAQPDDIRLVVLAGEPSYGDPAILAQIPGTPDSCHDVTVCGTARQVCWQDPPTGPVTLQSIEATIQAFYAPGPEALVDCP